MQLVIVESPFAGASQADIDTNVAYARACVRDCVLRGEAPIASHLLFTQPGILDDTVPEERALGMRAGLSWMRVADMSVVYVDRGISRGMRAGVTCAKAHQKLIELRTLATLSETTMHEFARTLGLV